jgi:hypothetical protein
VVAERLASLATPRAYTETTAEISDTMIAINVTATRKPLRLGPGAPGVGGPKVGGPPYGGEPELGPPGDGGAPDDGPPIAGKVGTGG